jgi:hypothetical protein
MADRTLIEHLCDSRMVIDFYFFHLCRLLFMSWYSDMGTRLILKCSLGSILESLSLVDAFEGKIAPPPD